MIYCLNPECEKPLNYYDNYKYCQCCGRPLKKRLRNRYQVMNIIGRGGFGQTYLAKDNDKLDDLCVVKQLVYQGRGTKVLNKSKQLFEEEAKHLQRLGEHTRIPSLLAYFEEDDYLYLVEQFIEGRNLLEILQQEGVFNEHKIRQLLLEILPILQFIHNHNVIHRDIKPENIMCRDEDGAYLLIDFGVSKILSYSLITQTGTNLGSYGYSSPEQILQGVANPTTDLFSLGASCFHLLSTVKPFELWVDRGYSWVNNWQDFIKTPLSRQMVYILDKLLSKDSSQRYQEAIQVLQDLHQQDQKLFLSPPRQKTDYSQQKFNITALTPNQPRNQLLTGMNFILQHLWIRKFIFIACGVISLIFAGQISRDFLAPIEINLLQQKQTQQQENTTFTQINEVPSGLFNYGGSTTWASIRKKTDPIIQGVWPDYRLRYTSPVTGNPGSGKGIKMLLEDQLSFSHSSRPLKIKEYETAKTKGYNLKEVAVAIDGIAIAVHPSLNIEGLTLTQIKDIYTGKLINWKQIGGPDVTIFPYSRHPQEGGTVEFFLDNVMEEEKFGANVIFVPNTTTGITKVASNPGAIYYASAIQVVPQCTIKSIPIGRQPNHFIAPYQEPFIDLSRCPNRRNKLNKSAFRSGDYPITRRLFIIVKQDGHEDERAGFAYAQLMLTTQGQKLIEEAGFISLYGNIQ